MNEKQITEIIKEWSKSHKEITLIRFNTTGIPDGKGGFRKEIILFQKMERLFNQSKLGRVL